MIAATSLQMHQDCVVVLDEAAGSELEKRDYYRSSFGSKWERFHRLPSQKMAASPFLPSKLAED